MKEFVLDTSLVLETGKPQPDERVKRWLSQLPGHHMWTSVIVFGELQAGISLLEDGARCLSIDEPTARAWGDLHASRQRRGWPLAVADGLIAATAIVRGLAIATRNIDDFADHGTQTENPWDSR